MAEKIPLKKIGEYKYEIPKHYKEGMRVPGIVYISSELMPLAEEEQALLQVANVAHLPGIVKYSLAMPDIHWGYGFPIGGVAATDAKEGVISPGGVGYDIACGVRLLRSNLKYEEIKDRMSDLVEMLFNLVPCGVGSRGKIILNPHEMDQVLKEGVKWVITHGYGTPSDIELIEDGGCLEGGDPSEVSKQAKERGKDQLGTLGAGNHFLEIQVVEEIYDEKIAAVFGLEKGQVTVTLHSGSRGLGYQVCDDYLVVMRQAINKYNISLPDPQLACAPLNSPEGRRYFAAMKAAANFAMANRQVLTHWIREGFMRVFNISYRELGMDLVYDLCHNIAKIEEHNVDGTVKELCVHRKGATRAYPPAHPKVPAKYREVGQPVLVPGDMGTASYVLVGTRLAMEETWGSTCHGAGRRLSRTQAKKVTRGRSIRKELEERGITVRSRDRETLCEEVPEAYKDVSQVVEVVHRAGLSKKVAKLRPVGVVKG